jgi:hypothetical protein
MYSTTPTANVLDGVQGTPYTVAQIDAVTNNLPFAIAIDVNTSGAQGETLQLFEVIVNGAVAYNFVGPVPIGNIANNGNGFGDWTLGTIDLSSFTQNATVLFHAVWNNASAGAESFFIVGVGPTPTPFSVPGPIAGAGLPGLIMIMACGGLLVLARRRRNALTA